MDLQNGRKIGADKRREKEDMKESKERGETEREGEGGASENEQKRGGGREGESSKQNPKIGPLPSSKP